MSKQYEDQPVLDKIYPPTKKEGPVECLGMEFENDEARREYFLNILREKLNDPEFRKIEGFPIGEDEDILALSDPPYYTACPNPFIEDFVKHYGKPYDPNMPYSKEPFAADVSEGKNDPVYNAHSYHTKVPHKAIMRYILHYTEPGDVILDGFCGTGMTGVAAQLCGDRTAVESLGYKVERDGSICQQAADKDGKIVWEPFSKLGTRRAILNDLSPAATFIAYNYNTPVDVSELELEAKHILKEVEAEWGWMYETLHTDGKAKGRINYTVWSDVFICPECTEGFVFWDAAVKPGEGIILGDFQCPNCEHWLSKNPANPKTEAKKALEQRRPISSKVERARETFFDSSIGETIRQAKQVPVLINYNVGKGRYEKAPDAFDLALIKKIEDADIPYWFPADQMPKGFNTEQPKVSHGFTHTHHFYTKRNLWVLSAFASCCKSDSVEFKSLLKFVLTGILQISSKQSGFRYDSRNPKNVAGGILKGTLYIPSLVREGSIFENFGRRLRGILSMLNALGDERASFIFASSTSDIPLSDDAVDYIFLDPPFGANINYSELNFIWESWLSVLTNNKSEAVENKVQGKSLNEYRHLMTDCFREVFRVLKPGRWMTVEFSNTKASVWNSIQTALTEAGFVIANISALDKKQGSFKAVTTPTAVKQDLIISAYKPNGGLEKRFEGEAQTEEGIWDFVSTHLKRLPVIKISNTQIEFIPERDPRILFDQMVVYYVRHGYPVPISSQEFQSGLIQRFPNRDGMYFLPEQAAEYDRKRMTTKEMLTPELFVSDEESSIQWLRQQFIRKPQTFQDIHPDFLREIRKWKRHEKPLELMELLRQNFLCYDGNGDVPSQIHSYLSTNFKDLRNLPKDDPTLRAKARDRWYVPDPNKAGDLEKLRERSLLREFEEYRESKQKRLKIFRLEAVRAGFKKAWQERDYQTIIEVARKIPDNILQEDQKLLMWYDQALTRTEED